MRLIKLSKHHTSKKKIKGRRNNAGYPAINDRKTKLQKKIENEGD